MLAPKVDKNNYGTTQDRKEEKDTRVWVSQIFSKTQAEQTRKWLTALCWKRLISLVVKTWNPKYQVGTKTLLEILLIFAIRNLDLGKTSNELMVKDMYSIPQIQDMLDCLKGVV